VPPTLYSCGMTLPAPMSWNRQDARAGKFDGQFLMGVMSTGIYCLPSCPARPALARNVRVFADEDAARSVGLRACKRCRPDLQARGRSEDADLFIGLCARVRADLETFANAAMLAQAAGIGTSKLTQLVKRQTGLTPAAWLRQLRLQAAEVLLRGTDLRVTDIALRVGFSAQSAFHRQFAATHGQSPAAWRASRKDVA